LYDSWNRWAFVWHQKDNSDEAALICAGRLFHACATAAGKARYPRVTRRDDLLAKAVQHAQTNKQEPTAARPAATDGATWTCTTFSVSMYSEWYYCCSSRAVHAAGAPWTYLLMSWNATVIPWQVSSSRPWVRVIGCRVVTLGYIGGARLSLAWYLRVWIHCFCDFRNLVVISVFLPCHKTTAKHQL